MTFYQKKDLNYEMCIKKVQVDNIDIWLLFIWTFN